MYEYIFKNIDKEMVLRALSEKLGITVDSQLCKDYAQAFNLSGDDALWKTLLSEIANGSR